jgi:DNA adenine methylase
VNRTSRSGILNGGMIGGRSQIGRWTLGARYNVRALSQRITAVARMADRIEVTNGDAVDFLRRKVRTLPRKTLIYLDPPYYVKGKDLYDDFYEAGDHTEIAEFVRRKITRQSWMVSYDNVKPIRDLYRDCAGISYRLGYSARDARDGSEVMYFAPGLKVPPVAGGMYQVPGSRNAPRIRPPRFGE